MKKISIAIMIIVVALSSCKKTPEVNLKYVDVERDLITVGTTTATVQCDYDYIATLKKAYLCYGEGENEDNFSSAEMRVVQNTLYVDLAGLTANTTYNYYYEFHNGFNSMRTALKTFKTEGGSGPTVVLPTVVTGEVTEITSSSAKGSGEVTNNGGAEVTESGICWSINENPTLNDNHVAVGTGTGAFTAMMNGLEVGTTYHVRAYATNEVGTAYGLDREFVTSGGGGSGVPEGAINGLFTINENGDQVYFSQGNLQYQASTNTWRFAEHQWDYVGDSENGTVFENGIKCENSLISSSYDGWVDLFGWGTSGYDHGAICYMPWSSSTLYSDYYLYGSEYCTLHDQNGQADWGYNAISNGGNQTNNWRTFSNSEIAYLLFLRHTLSGVRYAFATVEGTYGLILLPDDWDMSHFPLNNTNQDADFSTNIITSIQWNILEQHGAVFMPITGVRSGNNVQESNAKGEYWSSQWATRQYVYSASFINGFLQSQDNKDRSTGLAVRLICDVTLPVIGLPSVFTLEITEISANSAICVSEVTNDGGAIVTERGICWSTNVNPTLSDNHVSAGMGTGRFTANISGLEANTTYHVRAYAINEKGTAYGLDKEFTTLSGGGSGSFEYVDLCLPSGTLWATRNVGATSPEEYGDYFAWGEIVSKVEYDWSTYKYCNGSDRTLTKYCNLTNYGYNGFIDNLSTLLAEDDVASVNWGEKWRIPTWDEWLELYNCTSNTWTIMNGVNGRLFTASNGNSLFLPAAGHHFESDFIHDGDSGHYWSSSLDGIPDGAHQFYFDIDHVYQDYFSFRYAGLSVRAVTFSRKTNP